MNTQEHERIQQQLMSYLRQHTDVRADLDATSDLIDRGILDSLLITDLVLFTHRQFGIELTARDISPDNLRSIERLTRLIQDKREKQQRAA